MKVINIKGIKRVLLGTYKMVIEIFADEEERNLLLDSIKLDKELKIINGELK